MKKIASIAWKDTLVRFSERSEFLFFLVLPLLFTVLLSGGLFSDGDTEARISLLVVDEDNSELATELQSVLTDSEAVEITTATRTEAEAQFEDEKAPALLIIPAGFEDALMARKPVELDFHKASDDNDAAVAEQTILAAASTMSRALAVANSSVAERERLLPFTDQAQREVYFSQSLSIAQSLFEAAPDRVRSTRPPTAPADGEDEFDQSAQASSGQLITWVFIPLIGTSVVFVSERTKGTLRRLLTTPTQTAIFMLGTIVGQLALSIVQMGLLIGFGIWVMGVNWGQSPTALAVMLLSFALASVALGTMLGAFTKTDSQANSVSIMSGMAMALLGGCWFPAEMFPEVARTMVKVFPTTWAMQGLTDIVMRGQGLVEILPAAGVLVGFAVIFFTIGVWRFRYE